MSVGFTPNTSRPNRARRNLEVLMGGWVSPNFFMRASTSGVAGQALVYFTTENQVDIATALTTRYNGAGLLVQDVRDLSNLNGYRVPNSSVANFGDPVGVLQGPALVFTRTYAGTVARGDLLEVNSAGYLVARTVVNGTGLSGIAFALGSGMFWGVVEAVSDGDINPSTHETDQGGRTLPSNRNFIRARLF